MADKVITISESAEIAGISRAKAYRLARARKTPYEDVVRLGSTYAVPYLAFCGRLGIKPEHGETQVAE